MLLSHKTTIQLNTNYSNIVGHMCYAAYKLWNVCDYERNNYQTLGLTEYPDWYYQKKAHKDDLWYKNLPSQTAQEVCKLLDKSWKSFYTLQRNKTVENPQPPKFKHDLMPITYMQKAIKHEPGSTIVRLSLPKQLMEYMKTAYGISDEFLFLENQIFRNTDTIKQIKIYPPEKDGTSSIIVIYELPDISFVPDNGHYLGIDLGLHNLMTCYDNAGESFIVGRRYLDICHKYDKEIALIQSQWDKVQAAKGVKYPKKSKHLLSLYTDRKNTVNDYLHKVTRWVANYCRDNHISVVVIGDITGIRKDNNKGSVVNQKLHGLPYHQLYIKLQYKLALYGIRLIKQKEGYTSQCSPCTPAVSKEYASGKSRVKRGLYKADSNIYNADAVGAYNILRLYLGNNYCLPVKGLSSPEVIKVAA